MGKVLDPLEKHLFFCTEDLDIKATSLKKQFEDALDAFETANSLNGKMLRYFGNASLRLFLSLAFRDSEDR